MEKKVLLIADDIEMNRSVIKRFMGKNFIVLEAKNGQEVLDILSKNRVDVLLLDIIMPVLDGLEILKKIKEDNLYPDMAILVATSTKEKTERQALDFGADDIVAKPYDPTVIYHRMSNILEKYDLQRKVQKLERRQSVTVKPTEIKKEENQPEDRLCDQLSDIKVGLLMGKKYIANTELLESCIDDAVEKLDALQKEMSGRG